MGKEINRYEILKSAKKIIDNFHNALAKVEKEVVESRVERDECEREEKAGEKGSEEFRKIMMKNAPETKDECIEAERGKWV